MTSCICPFVNVKGTPRSICLDQFLLHNINQPNYISWTRVFTILEKNYQIRDLTVSSFEALLKTIFTKQCDPLPLF